MWRHLLTRPPDAIGLPIAADICLITPVGSLGYDVLTNRATQTGRDRGGRTP